MEKLLKNNKLIAEFMKYELGFAHYTDQWGYHQCTDAYIIPNFINSNKHVEDEGDNNFLFHQLCFHSSWDWLIPVLNKIYLLNNSLDFESEQYKTFEEIFSEVTLFEIFQNDISSVYERCIEYINYYNK